jgi:hypothetical protein
VAVAAAALTESGHTGSAYTLTGGRALDHGEVADAISRVSGNPVHDVPIDEEAARRFILDSARDIPSYCGWRAMTGNKRGSISSRNPRTLKPVPLVITTVATPAAGYTRIMQ